MKRDGSKTRVRMLLTFIRLILALRINTAIVDLTPPPQTPSVNPTFSTHAIFYPSHLPSAVKNRIGNIEI